MSEDVHMHNNDRDGLDKGESTVVGTLGIASVFGTAIPHMAPMLRREGRISESRK